MRRLAILFAIIAALSTVDSIVLTGTFTKIMQAPRRIHRALLGMAEWRKFLIGPLRLLQRTTSGGGSWLGQSN